jgi:hypothetical protein
MCIGKNEARLKVCMVKHDFTTKNQTCVRDRVVELELFKGLVLCPF